MNFVWTWHSHSTVAFSTPFHGMAHLSVRLLYPTPPPPSIGELWQWHLTIVGPPLMRERCGHCSYVCKLSPPRRGISKIRFWKNPQMKPKSWNRPWPPSSFEIRKLMSVRRLDEGELFYVSVLLSYPSFSTSEECRLLNEVRPEKQGSNSFGEYKTPFFLLPASEI